MSIYRMCHNTTHLVERQTMETIVLRINSTTKTRPHFLKRGSSTNQFLMIKERSLKSKDQI
jgi:hypothetical protein